MNSKQDNTSLYFRLDCAYDVLYNMLVVSCIPVKIRVHPVYTVLLVINTHAIWPAQLVSVDFSHVTSVAMAATNKWKVMFILQPISKKYIPRDL